jgi:hypothetical protein
MVIYFAPILLALQSRLLNKNDKPAFLSPSTCHGTTYADEKILDVQKYMCLLIIETCAFHYSRPATPVASFSLWYLLSSSLESISFAIAYPGKPAEEVSYI